MQMKQPAWESMPVLDVRSLGAEQSKMLARTFEAVGQSELAPVAQLNEDPVRIQIDDACSKVLGLPSLAPVRELLAREPGLSAVEISPRQVEASIEDEQDLDQPALFQ